MELLQQLLTVIISLGLAFLIAKIVSSGSSGREEHDALLRSDKKLKKKKKDINEFDGVVIKEVKSFVGELKNKGLEIEKKVEEPVIVEEIERNLVKEGSSEIVEKNEEIVHGCEDILNDSSELVQVSEIEEEEERKEDQEQSVEEEEEQELKVVVLEEKSIKEEVKTSILAVDDEQEENLAIENPSKEQIEVIQHKINKEIEIQTEKSEKECMFSDEEDWEGIERSEIENYFGEASAFTGSSDNNEVLGKLSSDIQMKLYGLYKVATEGPCYEPQPLALMVSARAKWHAWQRLGNMSPEVAMEQYTALLSENIPSWTMRNDAGEDKQAKSNDSPEAEVYESKDHNLSSVLQYQSVSKDESEPGDHLFTKEVDGTGDIQTL